MKPPRLLLALLLLFAVSRLSAHEHHHTELAREMSQRAQAFLQSLNDEDRAQTVFPFKSNERENFHYVPLARKGMIFKSMKASQRAAALLLLNSALSASGSFKAAQIMELEKVLYELENHDPRRDSEHYYLAIFGDPARTPWGWRFEGHHLSVNQTITDEGIAGTPLFFGANPGHVTTGETAGLRVLGDEEDMGRAFVLSLNPTQRKTAVIDTEAIREILTGQISQVSPLGHEGLSYGDLTPEQKIQLRKLLKYYLDRHERPIARSALERIDVQGMENVVFAWAGSVEPGEKHYYRIQGPTFVIEYANVQNNANHHHTVFRDFTNDFGRDVLREHYRNSH